MDSGETLDHSVAGVAIVGMTGRFPGAPELATFWRNLRSGVESIRMYTVEELEEAGIDPQLVRHPSYVRACGVLEDVDRFDPEFFGYTPKDGLLMDPQQRLFLQEAWNVLELAGYDPARFDGRIGVYGGASTSTYVQNIYTNPDAIAQTDPLTVSMGNDMTYLTTRVAFKLDLKGPSVTLQTACSTSLVALHLACQALLGAECDIALAGGVSIRVPHPGGYFYIDQGILSPDGHCRPFDAAAQGTIFSSGIGMLALKRLEDALEDGDTIHAVIRGSAINNDGSQKASFTAPGMSGQTEVIADALACADVEPETISYIETHGTATTLGDSIEFQALRTAFAEGTSRKQFCALGTLKANIGHLDAAAGIAGLLKAVLAMKHRELPPTPHFQNPNPEIRFETSPFYINRELSEWKRDGDQPRRAGISALGFGGTNAHVIVEEAPETKAPSPGRATLMLPVSARNPEALERANANLAAHLEAEPDAALADVAFTLQVGRREFAYRSVAICSTTGGAVDALQGRHADRFFTSVEDARDRSVVFLFPGQGAQHVGMGQDLYKEEPVFRDAVDRCAEALVSELGLDLRTLLFATEADAEESASRLERTAIAQPALFTIEYALAQLWISFGVTPTACLGHSVGEYVAACIADVLSLEDALRLVALRGRVMDACPEGVMVAVPLSEADVQPLLDEELWLSAVNAPTLSVVSGSARRIDRLLETLSSQGIEGRRLHTSHAFHSGLMEDAVAPFTEAVAKVQRRPARIPFLSCVSGDWITEEQLQDPAYWSSQIRQPVRFSACLERLVDGEERVALEVGPGRTLSMLARQHGSGGARLAAIPSLPAASENTPEPVSLMSALGRLWVHGATIDWSRFYADEPRHRVPLPTYPFERARYWIDPAPAGAHAASNGVAALPAGKLSRVDDWFYTPAWTTSPLATQSGSWKDATADTTWLLFSGEDDGIGEATDRVLRAAGCDVVTITPGEGFEELAPDRFVVAPASRPDHEALLLAIEAGGRSAALVLHLWSTNPVAQARVNGSADRERRVGFDSVLALTRAFERTPALALKRIVVGTRGVHEILGTEPLAPARAAVLSLARVIPQEYPGLACACLDLGQQDASSEGLADEARLVEQVLKEATCPEPTSIVAFRAAHRWVLGYRPLELAQTEGTPVLLREEGVYLITGGLGDIGLKLAESLARELRARLVLTGRSGLPPEEEWAAAAKKPGTLARRIRAVEAMRAAGAEVLVVEADAADATQMRAAVKAAHARFGTLNGVIHGAGRVGPDDFRPITQTDDELISAHLAPKLGAAFVLDEVLRGQSLDFCMLLSSLSTVLGGLGYAAYAGANTCLDTFAFAASRTHGFPWIAVNWDTWMRAEEEERLAQKRQAPSGFSMTGAEGVDAFRRALSYQVGPQLIVSAGHLDARIAQWVTMGSLKSDEEQKKPSFLRPRPKLQTDYVAPSGEAEETIAEIWQALLGVEQVGARDSFFELGGDSFTGLQVIAQLNNRMNARVTAVSLYEAPTVADLARLITTDESQGSAAVAVDESRSRGESRREMRLRRAARKAPDE
jgi:acyl transferase domain-containing protein/acyl carrier protein